MAKLKITIRKNKVNKEGMTTIQIALSHLQQTAYISTGIECLPENFVNGRIIKGQGYNAKNAKLLEMLNGFQERLDAIHNPSVYNIQQLKERISSVSSSSHYLMDTYKIYMDEHLKTNGSKYIMKLGIGIMNRYLNGRDVLLASVDSTFVQNFEKHLKNATYINSSDPNKHYSPSSISTQLNMLKCVVRYAERHGFVHYDANPFDFTKIPQSEVRNNLISIDELKNIRDYIDAKKEMNVARDIFMLSFYLGGINIVDMLNISYLGSKIAYKRRKVVERTNGRCEVVLPVTRQARAILDRYMDKDTGKLNFDKYTKVSPKDYDRYVHSMYCMVNDRFLKKLKKQGLVSQNATFYSARKCFAQIGMSIGISDSVINYILGHTNNSRGVIQHYSSVTTDMAEIAIEMITEFTEGNMDFKEVYRKNLLRRMLE